MIELNRKLGKSTFRVRDVNNPIQIQSIEPDILECEVKWAIASL